eukprot:Hpha_TRINITY_DN29689_c0_g1::TRINITY_DN29689_c0_g1_i1::g.165249::m.165249
MDHSSDDMLRMAFLMMDTDTDDKLNISDIGYHLSTELRARFAGLRSEIERELVESAFNAADTNRDGFVDFGEFVASYDASKPHSGVLPLDTLRGIVAPVRRILTVAELRILRRCFTAADSNADGFIDEQELQAVLLPYLHGESPNCSTVELKQTVNLVLRTADHDGDGKLSLYEFLRSFAEGQGVLPPDLVGWETGRLGQADMAKMAIALGALPGYDGISAPIADVTDELGPFLAERLGASVASRLLGGVLKEVQGEGDTVVVSDLLTRLFIAKGVIDGMPEGSGRRSTEPLTGSESPAGVSSPDLSKVNKVDSVMMNTHPHTHPNGTCLTPEQMSPPCSTSKAAVGNSSSPSPGASPGAGRKTPPLTLVSEAMGNNMTPHVNMLMRSSSQNRSEASSPEQHNSAVSPSSVKPDLDDNSRERQILTTPVAPPPIPPPPPPPPGAPRLCGDAPTGKVATGHRSKGGRKHRGGPRNTAGHGGDGHEEAAKRIQAVQRGRQARKTTGDKKKSKRGRKDSAGEVPEGGLNMRVPSPPPRPPDSPPGGSPPGNSPEASQKGVVVRAGGRYDPTRPATAPALAAVRARTIKGPFLGDVSGSLVTDEQLRAEWKQFDPEGTGFASRQHFRKAYMALEWCGLQPSAREIDRMIRTRSDDRLSYDEYCLLMLHRARI